MSDAVSHHATYDADLAAALALLQPRMHGAIGTDSHLAEQLPDAVNDALANEWHDGIRVSDWAEAAADRLGWGDFDAQNVPLPANLVVVNDGQYRWAADRATLLAALEAGGWRRYVHAGIVRYDEPYSEDPSGPNAPYTVLCNRVEHAPGYGPGDDFGGEDNFLSRDDLGLRVWTFTESEED